MSLADEIESIEALAWLERSDGKERTVSRNSQTFMRTEDALGLVRALYEAGTTKVLAQGVTVEYEFEDAGSLKVILPLDKHKRAALFAIETRALRDMGSPLDPEGERGQEAFGLGW